MLGHQIGVLTLLWREKDKITQQHSHFCVYLLMELVFQQKGEWDWQGFRVGGGGTGSVAALLSTAVLREVGGVRPME